MTFHRGSAQWSCRGQPCVLRHHLTFPLQRCAQRPVRAATQHEGQEVVSGACYEDVIDKLTARALAAAQQLPQHKQHIIGIAGAPGSGKSTLAQLVSQQINSACQQHGLCRGAVVAPMDGFHLYKAQLDVMDDPQAAYARRGAPWTFDAQAFVAAVNRIRKQGRALLPSFDHGLGDPVEDDIVIDAAQHSVVLVEGNYLFLQQPPWCNLQELFDDSWFVDVDLDTAMARVFDRQIAIGVEPSQSRVRIATNDRPNGELVLVTRQYAHIVVPSDVPFKETLAQGGL